MTIKPILLCLFALLLTACSDKITVDFNRNVDNLDQAEMEFGNALRGTAELKSFEWLSPKRVIISIDADDNNPNYSVDQAIQKINDFLLYQSPHMSFSIDITEERDSILKLLSLTTGETHTSQIDWNQAEVSVYYQSITTQYNLDQKKYFCAIKLNLEPETIPVLDYQYSSDAFKGYDNIRKYMSMMQPQATHTVSFFGLPVSEDTYTYKLQKNANSDNTYSQLFLIFEYINTTQEDCKKLVREKTGSNLYGAAGNVSARNNVIKVVKK